MRKEVSIAIIIGILLGAIILYGLKIASDTTNSLNQVTPTPTTQDINKKDIEEDPGSKNKSLITSHVTSQVLFEKEVVLKGKTTPNNKVVIIWEDDEAIITSDTDGNFTQKITLVTGENNVFVDALNPDQTLTSENLKLYYSTKPIE